MDIRELEKRIQTLVNHFLGTVSLMVSTGQGDIKVNEDGQLRAASIIKIPILLEAFRQHEEGILNLNQQMKVMDSQKVDGSGVIRYLSGETNFTLRNLIELMIIVSDNTASNIVMETLGIDKINTFLAKIGCSNTLLGRKFYDFEAVKAGRDNLTSARDMVTLLKVITTPNGIISENNRNEILKIMRNQQFRQKLPAYETESDVIIFNKTGEIPGFEHDVAIYKKGQEYAHIAVLTKTSEHNYESQKVIAEIGKHILEYLSSEGSKGTVLLLHF